MNTPSTAEPYQVKEQVRNGPLSALRDRIARIELGGRPITQRSVDPASAKALNESSETSA